MIQTFKRHLKLSCPLIPFNNKLSGLFKRFNTIPAEKIQPVKQVSTCFTEIKELLDLKYIHEIDTKFNSDTLSLQDLKTSLKSDSKNVRDVKICFLNNNFFIKEISFTKSSGGYYNIVFLDWNIQKISYYRQNDIPEYERTFDYGYSRGSPINITENNYKNMFHQKYCVHLDVGTNNYTIYECENFGCHGDLVEYRNGIIITHAEYNGGELIKIHVMKDKQNRDCVIENGTIIVWKVCKTDCGKKVYVKLLVPEFSNRKNVHTYSFMSIIEHAIVVDIFDKNGVQYKSAHNFIYSDKKILYTVGETVTAEKYDINGGGIYVYPYQDLCDEHFD